MKEYFESLGLTLAKAAPIFSVINYIQFDPPNEMKFIPEILIFVTQLYSLSEIDLSISYSRAF